IKQIAIQYQGTGLGVTLSGLSALSARLQVEPKTLQTATAATQQWNEFVKGLVVGYNSCAITGQQYQEGLMHIYPRLENDGKELENLRQLVLARKQIDEKHLQEVLESYENQLRAFAKVSGKEIDYERIEAIIDKRLRAVSARVDLVASQQVDLQKKYEDQQKEIEEMKRRFAELATPKQVESEIRTRLLAKAGEAEAAYKQGYQLAERFRFAEAIPYFKQALTITKLSNFYFALGNAYLSLPDLGQAEQVTQEGLDQATREADEKQQARLSGLLGVVLLDKGDLDGALRYSEQALKIDEKVYGPDHPNVGTTASNIGQILQAKGDLDGALRYSQRALTIDEKVYGPDRPKLARDASNIGMILKAKGDLDEALRYSERALKIDEKVYGPDHPNVAIHASNIGTILKDKGDLDGALRYSERALGIDEKVYGPDHPKVAIHANNIGTILQAKGDLDGALRYSERALKIDEKVYGADHPIVGTIASNIGTILQDKGDLDGALRYSERALKIDEKVYGPDHPKVAIHAGNIGTILYAKGDLDGALRYSQRALTIDEKVYGPD
ncbi:MAG: tetratricopeptide repeat protein, partial [Betaproteobacteria bacterium]|nr:tetratricopeptide repeat protein [Betaproteobacteria bacterium]